MCVLPCKELRSIRWRLEFQDDAASTVYVSMEKRFAMSRRKGIFL